MWVENADVGWSGWLGGMWPFTFCRLEAHVQYAPWLQYPTPRPAGVSTTAIQTSQK